MRENTTGSSATSQLLEMVDGAGNEDGVKKKHKAEHFKYIQQA